MSATQAVIAFLASANAVVFARMAYRGIQALLRGATRREADVLTSSLQQRDSCLQRLEEAETERDMFQRQVARRDYVLLRNGLEIPDDGVDRVRKRHD